jgi:hypothetical protein
MFASSAFFRGGYLEKRSTPDREEERLFEKRV